MSAAMVDLTTTNVWLAILATVSLIEFLMMCAAGFFAYRLYTKLMTTIDTVERVHIAPLHARADGILDDVERIADRMKYAQDSVSDALKHVAGTGTALAWAVKARSWPLIGVLQGLKMAAGAVLKNGRRNGADSSRGAM